MHVEPFLQRSVMVSLPGYIGCAPVVAIAQRLSHVIIPVLSRWEGRVVGIHERAQVSEPRGEVRQGMHAQPGQQEAGTDEGLEEKPQIGEAMLPTGVVGPGRMLTCRGRRRSGRVRT